MIYNNNTAASIAYTCLVPKAIMMLYVNWLLALNKSTIILGFSVCLSVQSFVQAGTPELRGRNRWNLVVRTTRWWMVAFWENWPPNPSSPRKTINHSNQSIAKSEEATVIKLSLRILEVISFISFADVSDLSFIVFPWRPLEVGNMAKLFQYLVLNANSPTGNDACSRPV